jgi:prolyl-tRNA editing enzyme YbaK/EbsC (Cys-tRNA(Pro) deacylase)
MNDTLPSARRETLSASAQKVQETLVSGNFNLEVIEFIESTRTSADAAARVGCSVGQIAKSIIFQGKKSGKPILVIASGSNRVDEKKVAALVGEPIGRANPEFVRDVTGYAIGGIPPLGHATPLQPLLDEDLFQYEQIWAAAGTPNAIFQLTPADLLQMTGGQKANVRQDA